MKTITSYNELINPYTDQIYTLDKPICKSNSGFETGSYIIKKQTMNKYTYNTDYYKFLDLLRSTFNVNTNSPSPSEYKINSLFDNNVIKKKGPSILEKFHKKVFIFIDRKSTRLNSSHSSVSRMPSSA